MWNGDNKVGVNMFCRFCGRDILDDSEFCPYCGKVLAPEQSKQSTIAAVSKSVLQTTSKENIILSKGLVKVTKAVCYVSLVVFLLCLFKMAPGFGMVHVISYIVIAAIAIGLIVLFNKLEPQAQKGKKSRYYWVSLISATSILLMAVALRIVYEAKVDSAVASIPNSGKIYVRVYLGEEFYSSNSGYVKNPKSQIRIGKTWYDNGDIAYITLNQVYSLRVGTGYDYAGGYTDTTIIFKPESLRNGYLLAESVQVTPEVIGEVTMEFTHELDFWSVVFY